MIQFGKGEEIIVDIEALAFGGTGLARYNNMVVFIDGALPGQKVKCRILKNKKTFLKGGIVEIIKQSPHYTSPKCEHFGQCGGCALQNLNYQQQLSEKQKQVDETLEHIGGISNFKSNPIIPSPDVYFYRNKMEFSFSRSRWYTREEMEQSVKDEKDCFLGFHAKGFYKKVINIRECLLIDPIAVEILDQVRIIAQNSLKPAYSTRDHKGFWRFLVIRNSINNKNLMVNIITSDYDKQIAGQISSELMKKFPTISSLLMGVTKSKASTAYCQEEYCLVGESTIEEKLGDYRFAISSQSFFQTNTKGAEKLYSTVLKFAEFKGIENVYDLYCGAGSISIYAQKYAKNFIGFESVPSAILNAEKNCQLNNVHNCRFFQGDLKDLLIDREQTIQKYGIPDVMIIDPPRG
ncbi:23S rRNA (uracil(1939)-C(5))-methyltransferase RlmD, partial [candidate division KSB1 bacterium]|nr:23S rRNA (uracil(1939)-C(5))-methyltransferase RlmD [candidate division KSB1 bacterium]